MFAAFQDLITSKKQAADILGININSTPEEINKAFKQKAFEVHPDRNPGDTEAAFKLKMLGAARDLLMKSNEGNPIFWPREQDQQEEEEYPIGQITAEEIIDDPFYRHLIKNINKKIKKYFFLNREPLDKYKEYGIIPRYKKLISQDNPLDLQINEYINGYDIESMPQEEIDHLKQMLFEDMVQYLTEEDYDFEGLIEEDFE